MSFDELLRTTALAARECTLFERLRALYEAKPGMQEAIVVGALGTKLLADPSFKHRLPEATDIDLLFGTIPGNLRDELASRFLIDKAEREYASMGMEVKERLIESPHKVYGFKDPKYEHIDIFDGNVGPVQLPEGLVHPTLRINEEQSITLKIGNPGFLLANYLAAATPKRLGRTRVLLETLASANKWNISDEQAIAECKATLKYSGISREHIHDAMRYMAHKYVRRSKPCRKLLAALST